MTSILTSNNHYEVLGLANNWTEHEIRKAYKRLAMEHHPDKLRDKSQNNDHAFKRIREAYDVLSNPSTKRKYDEFGKITEVSSRPMENSKTNYDEEKLEAAFKQLIQGKYPSLAEKRTKKVEEFEELTSGLPERAFDDVKCAKSNDTVNICLENFNKIRGVESFRQKVYLDDLWRKITKTEHIVVHLSGQRFKILTKKIQTPEGKVKYRQKITPL